LLVDVTLITLRAAVSEVAYKALLRSSGYGTKAGKPSFKVVKEIFSSNCDKKFNN